MSKSARARRGASEGGVRAVENVGGLGNDSPTSRAAHLVGTPLFVVGISVIAATKMSESLVADPRCGAIPLSAHALRLSIHDPARPIDGSSRHFHFVSATRVPRGKHCVSCGPSMTTSTGSEDGQCSRTTLRWLLRRTCRWYRSCPLSTGLPRWQGFRSASSCVPRRLDLGSKCRAREELAKSLRNRRVHRGTRPSRGARRRCGRSGSGRTGAG